MTEQFTCARCKRTFDKLRSDSEADQERKELWGDIPVEECDVLCHGCFKEIMALTEIQPDEQKPN